MEKELINLDSIMMNKNLLNEMIKNSILFKNRAFKLFVKIY